MIFSERDVFCFVKVNTTRLFRGSLLKRPKSDVQELHGASDSGGTLCLAKGIEALELGIWSDGGFFASGAGDVLLYIMRSVYV